MFRDRSDDGLVVAGLVVHAGRPDRLSEPAYGHHRAGSAIDGKRPHLAKVAGRTQFGDDGADAIPPCRGDSGVAEIRHRNCRGANSGAVICKRSRTDSRRADVNSDNTRAQQAYVLIFRSTADRSLLPSS
jgi:hypothetical protein